MLLHTRIALDYPRVVLTLKFSILQVSDKRGYKACKINFLQAFLFISFSITYIFGFVR